MRDRRRAADARDGADRGRLVRPRARSRLHAGDASGAALARARRGRFRERAFRQLPPTLRERYFPRRDAGEWVVAPGFTSGCRRGARINLVQPRRARRAAGADVVFCRNLFIYFPGRPVSPGRERLRGPDVLARLSLRRRIRVAAAAVNAVRARGHRRRVRVREVMSGVIKVLVVDDSAYVRKVVTQMLSRSPFIEVVGDGAGRPRGARTGRTSSSRT